MLARWLDLLVLRPQYAPAGTAIYYDNATHHTRLDGSALPALCRRTLHQYFARGGWDESTSIGNRPPTPPQTDWNVYPKRLAMHSDPSVRRLFSHWNTAMCEWAASDWSDEVRAKMPRAHTYVPADEVAAAAAAAAAKRAAQ